MNPTSGHPRSPNAAEERALALIDEAWLLRSLSDLVALPSWGGDEASAQERMAELLADSGFEVDVWEIDEDRLRTHPSYATELERDRPLGVVGVMTGRAPGPTLVLNGHVDVVPPGNESFWTRGPFVCAVEDGRVFGRGVLDMKGPLLAALAGIRAAVASGWEPAGRLLMHSVIGEEDGGLGTLASVLRGHTGDGAVVMEPTGLHVASAQAGALNFRLTVPGQAAHGALRYEGVSAIDNFIHVYRALSELESARNQGVDDPRFSHLPIPYPICVGTVEGGEWASSVAQRVTAEGRFGVPVGERVETARRVLEDHVARACGEHPWLRERPARLEWWGGQFGPCESPAEARIVEVSLGVAATLDAEKARPVGVPYGSDLRLLVNEGGTPGVLFGPGDIRLAHGEDESISIVELMNGARAVALTVMRFFA